jgi:hypothetical protein
VRLRGGAIGRRGGGISSPRRRALGRGPHVLEEEAAGHRRVGAAHELGVDGVGAQHGVDRDRGLTSLCAEVPDSGTSSSAPPSRLSCPQDGTIREVEVSEFRVPQERERLMAREEDPVVRAARAARDVHAEREVKAVRRRAVGERGGDWGGGRR